MKQLLHHRSPEPTAQSGQPFEQDRSKIFPLPEQDPLQPGQPEQRQQEGEACVARHLNPGIRAK